MHPVVIQVIVALDLVTRSAIEQYDLESTWSRWRKGGDYFQAAYLGLTKVNVPSDSGGICTLMAKICHKNEQ